MRAALLLWFFSSSLWAATYNLPTDTNLLPATCSHSDSTVSCDSLNLSVGTVVNMNSVELHIESSFVVGQDSQINGNVHAATVQINQGAVLNGNLIVSGTVYNLGNIIGYVGAKGSVSNHGTIGWDVNAPTIANYGVINGQQCNLNDNVGPCSPALTCFSDSFSSSAEFNQKWTISTSSGTFAPSIQSGRVRLTEAAQDQASRITMNRMFPAANNRVEIEFDYYAYDGNSADGIAVVLSDATVTPQSGGFGGSLGYAQRTDFNKPGFAGGWLGIGLDEYGNFARAVEGRVGGYTGSLQPDRVVIRGSANSQYRYIARSNTLSPALDKSGSTPGPGHRYRIVIDSTTPGQSMLSIERDTGSGFVQIISPLDLMSFSFQQDVPEKLLLSFTGSTGELYNRHELDNLQVCAALSEPIVLAPEHYRLELPPKGYFCGAALMAVKACDDEACNTLYTNPASLSLITDKGQWDQSVLNFNGETSARLVVDKSLADPGAGSVTAVVGGINPDPVAPVHCYQNGLLSDCRLTFEAMALAFSQGSKSRPFTPLGHQSSQAAFSQDIYVGLAEPQSCEADLNGQTLLLGVDCINPAVCQPAQFKVNGIVVNEGSYVNTQLTFGSDGFARIPASALRYNDAGSLTLLAKNSDQDAQGNSNQFVVKPTQLVLSTLMDTPHVAGANFGLKVEARGAAGLITPNYNVSDGNSANTSDLQVRLEKILPLNSGAQGILSLGGIASQDPSSAYFQVVNPEDSFNFTQGVGLTNIYYTEVGQVKLTLRDNDYQGAGSILSNSQTLERFIPSYFVLSTAGDVEPGCSDFTYMDQPFDISGQVEARNQLNARTANYFGSLASGLLYGRLSDGSAEVNRLQNNGPFALAWSSGQAAFSQSLVFNRSTGPDGPFSNIRVGVLVRDSDNVEMQAASNGFTQAVGLESDAEFAFRYGRALLINAYGPETENLSIPLETQYFDDGNWVLNQQDSCTSYHADRLIVGSMGLSSTVNGASNGGDTIVKGKPILPMMSFVLNAPGAGNSVSTLLEWQVDEWLKFNWVDSVPSNPTATATFGQFRGNDRLIFQREVFP